MSDRPSDKDRERARKFGTSPYQWIDNDGIEILASEFAAVREEAVMGAMDELERRSLDRDAWKVRAERAENTLARMQDWELECHECGATRGDL